MDEMQYPSTESDDIPPAPESDEALGEPLCDTPIEDESADLPAPEGQIDEPPSKQRPDAPAFRWLLENAELFVLCMAAIFLLFSFVLRICSVSGHSMRPTLQDGEILLISNLFYEPARGDIIVFHQTSEEEPRFNEPIVKRVIATEGQRVYIDFTLCEVSVDGVVLQEDYIQLTDPRDNTTDIGQYQLYAQHHFRQEPMADGKTHLIFEATVPAGCLFVMGDNRNNSADSRNATIGFVDEGRVLGRVLCRLLPTDAFGPVD